MRRRIRLATKPPPAPYKSENLSGNLPRHRQEKGSSSKTTVKRSCRSPLGNPGSSLEDLFDNSRMVVTETEVVIQGGEAARLKTTSPVRPILGHRAGRTMGASGGRLKLLAKHPERIQLLVTCFSPTGPDVIGPQPLFTVDVVVPDVPSVLMLRLVAKRHPIDLSLLDGDTGT